jgi:hypothetical protein
MYSTKQVATRPRASVIMARVRRLPVKGKALFYCVSLLYFCCFFTTTTTAFLIKNNPSSTTTTTTTTITTCGIIRTNSNYYGSIVPSSTSTTKSSQSSSTILFAEKNQPWDVIRFLQQSSKFVSIFPTPKKGSDAIVPGTVLWKAGSVDNDFEFAPLDDVVMGGASNSNFNKGTGKWKGIVTDANNGGFIGIRSTPIIDYDLSKCNGIEWTILTSAKDSIRLKVVLRDSTDFNGVGWTTSMDTSKSKQITTTFKIPFDNKTLKPSKFAKILTSNEYDEPFNKAGIKSFQLTYSKFEYDGILNPKFNTGDFEIQLMDIKTY